MFWELNNFKDLKDNQSGCREETKKACRASTAKGTEHRRRKIRYAP